MLSLKKCAMKCKDKIKAELMLKVAERLQNRAKTISKSWGANGYRIIKVDLNTGNNYYSPVNSFRIRNKAKGAGSPASQNFASGNSKINVTANGVIELIR